MRRLAQVLAVGALGLAALPAGAAAAPAITEFNAGIDSLSEPTAITLGPDGNLWFTARKRDSGSGAVGRISTLGVVTAFTAGFGNDSQPNSITASFDGNLWFTDPGDQTVGRLTPQGDVTRFSVARPGAKLEAIAAGADGNLWFADSGMPARIGRVTPAGEVTSFTAGITPNGRPVDIAAGPDGNMWFTETGKTGRVGRITPAGEVAEFAAGLSPGALPLHIAAGFDGNMWFTEQNGGRGLGRITPAGEISEFSAGLTADAKPVDLAPGLDGHIWFTALDNPDAIGRITREGAVRLIRDGLSAKGRPAGIAAGLDAGMWFTQPAADLIGRVDNEMANAVIDSTSPVSGSTLPPGATPPVLRRSVVVQAVSGRVFVRRPGGGTVPLPAGATVPLGSELDARAGTLRLTAALPGANRMQSAEVWGARFAVRQTAGGMTDLFIREAPQGCVSGPSRFAKAARRRPTLWARDRRGRFRTHGRNSVATVRGTAWSTTETCSGTVTYVAQGAVSVWDRRARRTSIVSAGRAYLARSYVARPYAAQPR